MRVAIRADASIGIGSGHVMRCMTLAEELKAGGAEVIFICRELNGHYCEQIEESGYEVMRLPAPQGRTALDTQPMHASWLGVTLDREQADIDARLPRMSVFDWIVVDHYALDMRWERAVASRTKRILVIDDLADRPHLCDLLLDQNLSAPQRYGELVPTACRILTGPRYALLRREFRAARNALRRRDGTVRSVLIFFGGTDAGGETDKALDALDRISGAALTGDVVVGGNNPRAAALKSRCEKSGLRFHVGTAHMAELMANADLALGATGTTTWERAALGLPALVVSIAANQEYIARTAHEAGLVTWLGRGTDVTADDWARALEHALATPEALRRQAATARETVDAQGAARVAEAMHA